MKLPSPLAALVDLKKAQLEATDCLRNDIVNTLRHENRLLMTLIRFSMLPEKTLHFVYKGHKVSLYIPDADTDLIQRDILMNKTFFDEAALCSLVNHIDLRGKHILDAGANIGNHAVFFAKVCGAASVLSFEPNTAVTGILERNIALNCPEQVTVIPKGLSDSDDHIYITHEDSSNIGGTSFDVTGRGIGFACSRIDSLNLSRLDFLKIDVEGMPERVIRGAQATIDRFKPIIYVELFPHEQEVPSRMLRDAGYHSPIEISQHNFLFTHKEFKNSGSSTF